MHNNLFSSYLYYLYAVILFILAGCGSSGIYISEEATDQQARQPPVESPLYSVFLVGDAGALAPIKGDPVGKLLKRKANEAGEQSAVVFLGDNIYPDGLPEPGQPGREEAEARIRAQLDIVKQYSGRVFFIPGNHDWNNSQPGGLEAVGRQEAFVEQYLGRGNTFLPDDGFPGPVDIELVDDDDTPFDKDIRLILMDTEWWLYQHEKAFGDTGEYELQDAGDFLVELRDIIRKRTNDHVIVAGHHPLYSNGTHGGYFPPVNHLLPPVFGSLYVWYRKFFGFRQDISHYRYQELKNALLEAFDGVSNLIYASGHDHSLQHFWIDRRRMYQHYLVSGAGSRPDFVAAGRNADFTYRGAGFMVIRYYEDGSSWLEAWTPGNSSSGQGRLLYRRQLAAPDDDPFYGTGSEFKMSNLDSAELKDSTITIAANSAYDKPGPIFRTVLGAHNRDLWAIPVEFPVFDIATVEGGLEAVKLGGKGQSNTLRLENEQGREFVLRSVDKVAGKIWDEHLKNTLAEDLAQDQFSILNPYGALMVPPLAEAVGIYHTNPRIYYIPHDPRLGEFAHQVGGSLALFEERPDDDMSHAPHLSGSREVISTRAMLSEVEGDLDHRVDQPMMLRNRLLDIWISDWDRHEDQWRWASFEPFELDSSLRGEKRTEGKIYQPIPRDRDVAFMVMNGVLPTLGKLTSFRLYQDFTESYGNLKGLTMNSLALTRRFTNQLTRREWMSIARDVTDALTNEIIKEAVGRLPQEVQLAAADRIEHVMRVRRDQLPEIAGRYYELISKVVDVVGSHKKEFFEIERLDNDRTRVRVFKRSEKEEPDRKPYYQRTFYPSETREVRIYGMGDDDEFEIKGAAGSSILVRIVGGSGADRFTGKGLSPGGDENIKLYDTTAGNTWNEVAGLDIKRSNRSGINTYDYSRGYSYNTGEPLLFFGHNRDDGIFMGGGGTVQLHGFKKYPFAASHTLRANVAARTGAFNIRYNSRFTEVAGRWDGELDIRALTPNNIRNFLGFGNETKESVNDDDYYKARLWQFGVAPSLRRSLGTGVDISVGPYFQVTNVREDAGRFIGQPQAGVSPNTFEDQWYTGLAGELRLQDIDNSTNPRQGFRLQGWGDLNLGVKNTSATHGTVGSSLALYFSPSLNPQFTLAARVGSEHNIGPFPFYKANSLGGVRNLRGLRSTRYNGRTNFYNNMELRGKLFDFSSYVLGGEAGFLGFLDHGRVWTDGEQSDTWHWGYGGGLWVNLFRMSIVRGSIGFSEGEWNILAGAGFFF
ncbi:metallophosphoesterase [Halalkalibaculum sp. DA3122]|uniref:metallophosphoesterase n=1 Tax=Halalkalibaculum sp. DA3122 TaxID=3373607 RepID=UPI0037550507